LSRLTCLYSIKELYPDKKVTLIHSRDRLLPLFDKALHDETLKCLERLDIECILSDRVILSEKRESTGWATLKTQGGRTLTSDLRVRHVNL
jgi:pyruvate/2-oxoglutarate dehydrogenase complex dihydrolipoamide dehydrogenase (E3) component